MQVLIQIAGVTPLLMHNERLADPLDVYSKQLGALNKKRQKLEEDHQRIAEVEYRGGIYHDGERPFVPSKALRKSIIEGARLTKGGKSVERGLYLDPHSPNIPLIYDGPKDVAALMADANFVSRMAVGISTRRIMRTRPMFKGWSLKATATIDTAVLEAEALERYVQAAGLYVGLLDGRSIGHGRFEAKVRPL